MTQPKFDSNLFTDYDEALQRTFISFLIADHETFKKCRHLVQQDYFDDHLRRVVRFILEFEAKTNTMPAASLVRDATKPSGREGIDIKSLAEIDMAFDPTWFIPEYEEFARFRAFENVMLTSYDVARSGVDGRKKVVADASAALTLSVGERKHKFNRETLTQTLARPFPQWLFKGLCFERGVGVLFGESQTFKSFLVLALSGMLAHGMIFNGRQLTKRNVIYVAGEGREMIGLRRLAWLKHHGLPEEDDGLDLVPTAVNMLDPAEVADFVIRMKEYDTDDALVALDTLSTMIAGKDENTAEIMSQVVAVGNHIAAELGCTVLLIHHTGRDGDRARGSYALYANIDFEWKAERVNDMLVRLQVTKQKDGSLPHFFFQAHKIPLGRYDEEGEERDSLALVPTTQAEMAHTIQPGQDISQAEADCRSIALVMEAQTLSRRQLARLVMKPLSIGERAAENRIDAALPLNVPVETSRGDETVILLRSKAEKGYAIKLMVKSG